MGSGLLYLLLGGSITGAAVAVIARALLPGKQSISGIATLVIGTAAGFIGGLIAKLIGLDDAEGWKRILPLAISVGLAMLAIYFWVNYRNEKLKSAMTPGPGRSSKAATGGASDGTAVKPGSKAAANPVGAASKSAANPVGPAAKATGPKVKPINSTGKATDGPLDPPTKIG